MVWFIQTKWRDANPSLLFPRSKTPPAFLSPLLQLNPLECHNYPGRELTKAALRSIFQFQPYFMSPANVFSSQPHSGWLTEITSLHRSGSLPHLFKQSKANQQKWKAFWLQWRFHCFCFSFQESFWTAVAAICTSRWNSSCPEMEVLGSSSPQIVQMPSLHLYIHNWLLWGAGFVVLHDVVVFK